MYNLTIRLYYTKMKTLPYYLFYDMKDLFKI